MDPNDELTMIGDTIRTDVAVVGAGLAGLTAARLVRDAGRQVVVLDATVPGGRARSDVRGGAILNRGPHAVYLGGPAERVLNALRVPLHGGPPSSTGGALLHGEVHELPSGALALARTKLLSAKGKVAAGRLLSRLARIRTDDLGGTSFAAWLDDLGAPDDARALVEMLARVSTYANCPDIAAADMVVAQMQMAFGAGVRYVDGGWQALVDALVQGLDVRRATAASVCATDDGVDVLTVDGVTVHARAVIVAVASPDAAGDLVGRRLVTGPAVEASCLDLATSVPASPGLLLGIDQPLYLSNHCPPARLAPAGTSVVHVARYLTPGEQPDPHEGRAELAAHAARAGLTVDVIVEQRYLHRMTVVGGLASAALGGLRGRPGVDAADQPGVFLAGDWVGPTGHLLDASLASAEDAARRAVRVAEDATLVGR